jgi:hypothetical protein
MHRVGGLPVSGVAKPRSTAKGWRSGMGYSAMREEQISAIGRMMKWKRPRQIVLIRDAEACPARNIVPFQYLLHFIRRWLPTWQP